MHSRKSHSWISQSLVVVIFAAFCAGTEAQTRNPGKQVSSVAELLVLAADPKTIFDEVQVSRFLGTLSDAERRSVEHQLIGLPHEELIAGILVAVLKMRDEGAAELIASRVSGWKPGTQLRALEIAGIGRGPFQVIPRTLLQDASHNAGTSALAGFSAGVLGRASLVLAKTGNPTDLQMIQSVAHLRPKSWGIWMALAYGDGMNASLAALAETVYQDTSADVPLRVAAATALEAFDAKAGAYAIAQIQSYLAQFGSQDALTMVRAANRATAPGTHSPAPEALQLATFTNNMYILSSLLVLKSDSARQLTLQQLTVKNQVIRMFCGIVAARRWPADLLKAGRALFTEHEYADLAAVIAIYRPEQAAAAAAAAPADKLATAKSRIIAGGLGVALLEAATLSYF